MQTSQGTSETTRSDLRSDHDVEDSEHRWVARPLVAGILRCLVVVLPVSAGIAASLTFDHLIRHPAGWAMIAWLLGSLAAAGVSAFVVERAARRLLPLAALLRMSLLFPDKAPSRYRVARTAANPSRLAELAEHTDDVRSAAAAEVLALLAQLTKHDRHTRGHSERVRVFSDLLAEELGIKGLDRDKLRWGALLHDIGKISVPAAILNKKGRPTPEEWAIVQGHPEAGEVIAGPLFEWLGEWAGAITEHHERYDGGGYPTGLPTSQLSLAGRIVAVTDSYETMTAARSYKKPMATAAARQELTDCAGKQFDPDVVRAFLLISLSRVTRAIGPLSWLLHLPFAARLQLIGAQATAGISGAAAPVAALGVGTLTAAALTVSGTLPAAASAPAATTAVTHHTSKHRQLIPTVVATTSVPIQPIAPVVHPQPAATVHHRHPRSTTTPSPSASPTHERLVPVGPHQTAAPVREVVAKPTRAAKSATKPAVTHAASTPTASAAPPTPSAKAPAPTAPAPTAPTAPAPTAPPAAPVAPIVVASPSATPTAEAPGDNGNHYGQGKNGAMTLQQIAAALASAAASAVANHGGPGTH